MDEWLDGWIGWMYACWFGWLVRWPNKEILKQNTTNTATEITSTETALVSAAF